MFKTITGLHFLFLSIFFAFPAHAIQYTYQSSSSNPLHDVSKPSDQSPDDNITLIFNTSLVLAPNSTYNISVGPSTTYVDSWSASDTLFGIYLTGVNVPISLVPAPRFLEGGALCAVGVACFAGALVTDPTGQIMLWNVDAFGAPADPYLVFVTVNTPSQGALAYLGSTQGQSAEVQFDQQNGRAGFGSLVGFQNPPHGQ